MSILDEMQSDIYSALENDTLTIPRLPDMVHIIDANIDNDKCNIDDIIHAASHDATLTLLALRLANSVKHRSPNTRKVSTIYDAVKRLGLATFRDLIIASTVKSFSVSDRTCMRLMQERWKHSVEIGSVAAMLCTKHDHLRPDVAMMCGILHDIGVIPVLDYLSRHGNKYIFGPDEVKYELFSSLADAAHVKIGEAVAKHWNLPSSISNVIKYHHDHGRRRGFRAAYSDLIALSEAFDAHNEGRMTAEGFNECGIAKDFGVCNESLTMFIKQHYEDIEETAQVYH